MAERRRSRELSRSSETDGGAESKGVNAFANDGSFMALFKKMEEEKAARREAGGGGGGGGDGDVERGGRPSPAVTVAVAAAAAAAATAAAVGPGPEAEAGRKPAPNTVGKRRGGAKLALKTGMVAKKHKADEEAEARGGDAWAKYMAEVKKYKAHQCSDDDKTRPLVK